MKRNFKEAFTHRRTYYAIGNQSPVSDSEIQEIVRLALLNVPSAFNSQSTRIVLLLREHHLKLWSMVKETLRKIVPAETFAATENKIDRCFAAGYGTVLFLEDQEVVKNLQEAFVPYQDRFPIWSEQTSAMHQLAIWTLLEDAGLAASLQHYNPLIDDEVHSTWSIPDHWKLIAQMPFGNPLQQPEAKEQKPLDERLMIF